MRPYVLFSPNKNELTAMSAAMTFLMQKKGNVQLPETLWKLDGLRRCLEDPTQLELMVCDVTAAGVIPILEQIRQHNGQLKLVLVADETISPVLYIRPTVLPTALLWRPLHTDKIRDTLWEVMAAMNAQEISAQGPEQVFTVEFRGDVRRIPYRDILFFEASNKRLSLHTARKEIPFSGTLERLEEQLPEEFIRIHKSFIVNRNAITQVQFGQNLAILEGGITVPVSRSYKSALKAVFA